MCVSFVLRRMTAYDKSNENITDITTILVPSVATELNINGNYLTHIPVNYFKQSPQLRKIWAGQNAIKEIPAYTFADLSNLQKLGLAYNHLERITKYMFKGL